MNGVDPQAWLADVLARDRRHAADEALQIAALELEASACHTGGMSAAADSFNEVATVRIDPGVGDIGGERVAATVRQNDAQPLADGGPRYVLSSLPARVASGGVSP